MTIAGQKATEASLRERLEELQAVYQMASAVARAETLEEMTREAFDTFERLLGADRVALLLTEGGRQLRFVAWRGLSDEYRAAIEARSPDLPHVANPQPVSISDIETDSSFDDIKDVVRREGLRAFAFVPLAHGERLVGRLVIYFDEPRALTEGELELAQTIASHLALATGRRQAEDALRLSRDELAVILGGVTDGITVQDPAGALVYANGAAAEMMGFASAETLVECSPAEIMQRFEVFDERGAIFPLERLPGRLALQGLHPGEEVLSWRVRGGGERWSIVSATPVFDDAGAVLLAINIFRDITERKRSEERVRFLAEAGEALNRSLDYEHTLSEVARLAVPLIADWCVVYMAGEDGAIHRLAVEHFGGDAERVHELLRGFPLDPDATTGVPEVMRSGSPLLEPEITSGELTRDVDRPEELAGVLAQLGVRSAMTVPLTARGRTFGAISFVSAESGRRFGPDDLELAQELARRASTAVDNARLFKESQEALALFDTLLQSAPVAMGFWDRELRYLKVNEALAELNGLPADEHVGKSLAEVVPRLASTLEPIYRHVIDSGEPYVHLEQTTAAVPLSIGQERHWLTSYYPVRTPAGEIVGLGGVIMEITERKRAEAERARLLAESLEARERLRFLAEASTLLASSLDFETTLATAAHLAVPKLADVCTIDIVQPDGEVQRLAAVHVDPEQREPLFAVAQRWPGGPEDPFGPGAVIRTGRAELGTDVTNDFLAANAQDARHLETLRSLGFTSYLCVPLQVRDRVVGAITLITTEGDRRLGETDLALAEELARRAGVAVDNARLFHEAQERAQAARVLDAVGDGVFLVDSAGIVRLWNPAAELITGLQRDEVVGRRVAESIPGWSEAAPLVPVADWPRAASTRAQTVPLELGGREVWLSISGVGFADGIVYAFRDLTEERAVEQLKSDFVSTVSHELRTPLAAIYGAALTLGRTEIQLDGDQRARLLAVIASESDRLARTINDILWASRLDSGQLHVSLESCDAAQLTDTVVAAQRAHLPENVEVVFEPSDGLPAVRADPDKLRQVLANLVDNGVKYSPDGGRVTVELVRDGRKLRFGVVDEGLGIPPGELARIFEKFYRLDPQLTRGVGGTGLGLYICRELVRRMDGRIWVQSRPGQGSAFFVELPLV